MSLHWSFLLVFLFFRIIQEIIKLLFKLKKSKNYKIICIKINSYINISCIMFPPIKSLYYYPNEI